MTISLPTGSNMPTPELAPEGRYLLEITDAATGPNKFNGEPQLTVRFVIVGGDYAGKRITQWYSLKNPGALTVVGIICNSVGLNTTSGLVDEAALPGRRIMADVGHYKNPRNGKTNYSLRNITRPPAVEPPASMTPPPMQGGPQMDTRRKIPF